jgi:hypothetical protein
MHFEKLVFLEIKKLGPIKTQYFYFLLKKYYLERILFTFTKVTFLTSTFYFYLSK